jgi:nucleotide-binding universal stress UspA family protein
MKILIGVDDSAYSQAAMDWIKRMNWPKATELVLLSAAPGIMVAYTSPEMSPAAYTAEHYKEDLRFHQEIAARYERQVKDLGFTTRALVVEGDPREAIVKAARETHADLIVVGSHGRTGLSKLVMGSVASHVLAHAPCSVLVVKLPKLA